MSCFTLVAPRRSEDASAFTLDLRNQSYLVGPKVWTTKREKRGASRRIRQVLSGKGRSAGVGARSTFQLACDS